jgi:FkbM family methyltransferase
MKQILPHTWRQALKRRQFVVRDGTSRLQTLRRAGFVCTGAIDGGFYQCDWAHEFWSVYPLVPVLMIEP